MQQARVLAEVGELLERLYGDREEHRCAHGNPLDDLIETILSQNTSRLNRLRAWERLRATFPTWEEVLQAPREDVEEAIRPAGLARIRSERIQRLLASIQRERGGLDLDHLHDLSDEDALRELLRYDGVGPKTAYCVLLFAMDRDVFPIDVHIHRILKRLGIIPAGMSVEKAHAHVLPFIASRRHLSLHLNLISLGRETCRPTRPNCRECPLADFCHYRPGY